jgi:integrase
MPRLVNSPPKYRRHKFSGKAIVTLNGREFYLGPYGSKASRIEYDRLIAEWMANHRHLSPADSDGLTITELAAAYLRHAKAYYRKDGVPTPTLLRVKAALRVLKEFYGHSTAVTFGPLALQAIQQRLVRQHKSRRYINYLIEEIKRVFRWGTSQELVPVTVHQALSTVPGLRKGRTDARESEPVRPVAEATVNATLDHLPPIVADMVRLQRLTGARPGEICTLRPCDVDMSGLVWAYRPQSHKTEHHGRERVIFIGPKGQEILRPYLLRDKGVYCFCPAESERRRRDEDHVRRKTPLRYGNRPGSNRQRRPQRSAGQSKCWTVCGRPYSQARAAR